MTNLSVGDQVVCRICDGVIIGADSIPYDSEHVFDIIAIDQDECYTLYIPDDLFIRDSILVTLTNLPHYGLAKKFIDSHIYHIIAAHIVRVYSRLDGMSCMRCGEWVDKAEVNRLDANGKGAFICWLCRSYPYR